MAHHQPYRFVLLHRISRYTVRAFRDGRLWWRRWRFEVAHRLSRWTLLIYSRAGDNYTAACQVTVRDGIGYIDTLQGRDFYVGLAHGGFDAFRQLGVSVYRADVRRPHLVLIQRALRGVAEVREIGETTAGQVRLVSIEMRPLSSTPGPVA